MPNAGPPGVAPRVGLRGIIDAVVEDPEVGLIPVEHKPLRRAGGVPYDSERVQVAAEALLLEEVHALSPRPYGVVVLGTVSHRVALTSALRDEVRRRIAAIRKFRPTAAPNRSHAQVGRCRACGMRPHCDQAL